MRMKAVYGGYSYSHMPVVEWCNKFRQGRESTKDLDVYKRQVYISINILKIIFTNHNIYDKIVILLLTSCKFYVFRERKSDYTVIFSGFLRMQYFASCI